MTAREFEKAVANAIADGALLRDDGSPVIVALSGGADSVALLAVLNSLGYNTEAAHCNFHLRGAESMRDMGHAASIADRLGVNILIKDFNVSQRMQATGESMEMAARALRYEWFEVLLEKEHAQAIAVGHHREDQAETFLLNALRGSGIAGLAAMAPRNGYVVRPMLGLTRRDIEEYLHCRGLGYIVDSSNADNSFRRNSLRNRVIPEMDRHFPDAAGRLADTAAHVRDNLAFYNYAVKRIAPDFFNRDSNSIDINALASAMPPEAARLLLFEMLRRYGFNMTHVANIMSAESGTFVSGDTLAELSRGTLSLRANNILTEPDVTEVSLRRDIAEPLRIAVSELPVMAFAPAGSPAEAYFDAEILNGGHTFQLRHPRRGDRMRPFGMTGSRLVSDILKEAHISPLQKREAWLLTMDNKTILWIIGIRASAHYSLTPETRRFLRLTAL